MKKESCYHQFSEAMDRMAKISEDKKKQWFDLCTLIKVRKGEQFIVAGEHSRKVAFNINGIFRLYYIDLKGNDYTKGFMPKDSLIISYSALVENRASYFSIEALNDCDVLVFDYDTWMTLIAEDLEWYPLLLKLVERAYFMKEKREKAFLLDDATIRYLDFKKDYSLIEKELKQYHIASFLGITPVALSRIKRNLKDKYI